MNVEGITEADLIEALRAAVAPSPTDDPGLTTNEIAEQMFGRVTSHTRRQATDKLRALQVEGKLRIGRRRTQQLNGNYYAVAVYTIT